MRRGEPYKTAGRTEKTNGRVKEMTRRVGSYTRFRLYLPAGRSIRSGHLPRQACPVAVCRPGIPRTCPVTPKPTSPPLWQGRRPFRTEAKGKKRPPFPLPCEMPAKGNESAKLSRQKLWTKGIPNKRTRLLPRLVFSLLQNFESRAVPNGAKVLFLRKSRKRVAPGSANRHFRQTRNRTVASTPDSCTELPTNCSAPRTGCSVSATAKAMAYTPRSHSTLLREWCMSKAHSTHTASWTNAMQPRPRRRCAARTTACS